MARKAEVIITCDASTVKQILEGLNRELNKTAARRKELQEKQAAGTRLTKQEATELQKLVKYENALEQRQQKITQETKKMNDVMKNLAGSTLKDLKKALQEGKAALNNMTGNDPRRKQLVNDLRRIQQQIDKNTGAVQKHSSALKTTLKNLVAYGGVFAIFNKVKSTITSIFTGNLKLSDSLTDIRKVSNLTIQEIDHLQYSLMKIDTRASVEELDKLAYAGAKLGMGQYGAAGLASFVRAANKVNVALKEDLGEDALTAMSKLVEVMGLIPKMGIEKSMDAAGSAIFTLSTNSTATGKNIIEMSKRLMGLANVSHVTTAELLALSSASDAMGLMPEVSATAFNKVFTNIQSNTAAIEKSLDMSEGTLQRLINEGKTMEAIVTALTEMHGMTMAEMKNRGVFKALGSDGARLNNVMATMANRIDTLKDHIDMSNESFNSATAIQKEYLMQQESAQGYMERAANIWSKAFINPEGVSWVKDLAVEWYELSKELTSSSSYMNTVKFILEEMVLVVKTLIRLMPVLINYLMFYGIARSVMGVVAAYNALKTSLIAARTATISLTAAQKASGIALFAAAVAYTVSSLMEYDDAAKEAKDAQLLFNEAVVEAQKIHKKQTERLDEYIKKLDSATLSQEQRTKIINKFNREFGTYISKLGIEINTVDDLKRNYHLLNEELRKKAFYEQGERLRQDYVGEAEQRQTEAIGKLMDVADRYGFSQDIIPYITYGANSFADPSTFLQQVYNEMYGAKYGTNGKLNWSKYNPYKYTIGEGDTRSTKPLEFGGSEQTQEIYDAINALVGASREVHSRSNRVNDYMKKYAEGYTPDSLDIELLPETEGEYDDDDDGGDGGDKVPKWMRAEKAEAEKNAKAVIGSIEEFYRLQEAAANELAANGQLTGEDFNMLVKHIQDRKDKVLLEARRLIVGDPNEFDKERSLLKGDIVKRDDAVSNAAMQRILEANPGKEGAALRKYDGSKEVYGLDSNAFLNDIRKNAAQNELNIQRRQADMQQEIEKILMQYQFVEQAQRSFGDKLVKLGIITDGYDKVVQQLANGTEVVANTRDVQALANKAFKLDNRKYGVDINDPLEMRNMVDYLMTNQETGERESFASIFPDLDKWMAEPEAYMEAMQAFYQTMLDMDGEYYEAQKKAYERDEKLADERWRNMGWTTQQEKEDIQFEMQESLRTIQGEGESFGQTYGFADTIADDPEIARIKNRMEWRMKELEDLKARSASEWLIMKKQNEAMKEAAALAAKISQEVSDRISKVETLSAPLNSFGEEVGQMLGEQWQGISRDGELSFGEMARNMGIEYAKLTLKMASENLMKKLQQGLYYKQLELQAMQHQVALTQIQATGQGVRAGMDAAEIGKEGTKATIMTMFGVSEGSAKTIAKLGYWGIPLIGVITSVLMGLLNSAKATAKQATDSTSTTSSSTNTKLVSEMLTYDSGNVNRYVGTDGKVYTATEEPDPGTGLVTHPIATTVQGEPALVAENGPEIVIGRKTTRAIMMNEPQLIKHLATYEQHRGQALRPYDNGNAASVPSVAMPSQQNDTTLAALNHTLALLQKELASGIKAGINMYGPDGIYENHKKAEQFMRRYE